MDGRVRRIELVVFLIIGGLATAVSGIDAQPTPDAGAVIAAARKALGGEKRLSAVKSVSITGRTQQARISGANEFAILCERPDRCARTDEVPGRGVQQELVGLTLGMFAGSFSSSSLTFSYMGQDEMPQGKADVIEARGPDGSAARLFFDRTSRLPILVSWMAPAAPIRPGAVMTGAARGAGAETQPGGPSPRQAGGAAAPPTERPVIPQPSPPQGAQPGAPAARLVESRIYYGDYREVDGLQLPFRLRRTSGGETVEETIVDRYRINPGLDQRRFEVKRQIGAASSPDPKCHTRPHVR
jgi:hypothetical protein